MDPDLARAILSSAAYGDVFDYPLTAPEIQRYLVGMSASLEEVEAALEPGDLLSRQGDYYCLPGREALAGLRRMREEQSAQLWRLAASFGKLIALMPFVRMLAVTGSLAVNNAERGADVDYLIVAAPGRVWTARAGALAVARLARLWKVELCPNYVVSERTLTFSNESLYTAHELAQMVPLCGLEVYEETRRLNGWIEAFLPNAIGLPPTAAQMKAWSGPGQIQTAFERMIPKRFEGWEMKRKIRKLRREQSFSSESAFSADLCKGHDRQHAHRTERLYQARLESLVMEAAG